MLLLLLLLLYNRYWLDSFAQRRSIGHLISLTSIQQRGVQYRRTIVGLQAE